MQSKFAVVLFAQLSCLTCALAESAITIPWVGYSYSGNYFAGYEGKIVGTDGDKTTYEINCPADITSCIPLDSPMTFIAGSNTYDMILSDPLEYTSSGCTFAGAPTPTTATCSYTQTLRLGTYSTSRTNTYNVPDSTVAREIYSATLAIAGSTSLASTATKTATEASVTHASTTGSSSNAASSDTEATGAATNIATTTTASGNGAYKTSVPMMLMGGLIAGVALNL